MQLRKRPRQPHLSLDERTGLDQEYFVGERLSDSRPGPEEERRALELSTHLHKCAAVLSPNLRKTFQLRVLMGLSVFETARILGLPHGTVKVQLARAREKIERSMQPALESVLRTPRRRREPVTSRR